MDVPNSKTVARRVKFASVWSNAPRMARWDRHLWLAVLVAAAIVLPRSALVSRAQSEGFDDEYHLSRGMAFWYGTLSGARLNDPPLGAAISAIPMVLLGCKIPDDGHVLYNQRISLENLLTIIALWKSLLFLPMVGV